MFYKVETPILAQVLSPQPTLIEITITHTHITVPVDIVYRHVKTYNGWAKIAQNAFVYSVFWIIFFGNHNHTFRDPLQKQNKVLPLRCWLARLGALQLISTGN